MTRDDNDLWRFFAVAFGGTAMLHGALMPTGFSLDPTAPTLYLYLAGLAAPSATAIALTPSGERAQFLREALTPRGGPMLYVAAILAQPALLLLAWLGLFASGRTALPVAQFDPVFALLALGQIWVVLGEEIGWRGFALPRLIRCMGARGATLTLAAAWGVWHAPMFFVAGSLQAGTSPWLFAAAILCWSAVHSALFLRARPSILANLVFHACANLTLMTGLAATIIEPFLLGAYVAVGAAALVVVGGKAR